MSVSYNLLREPWIPVALDDGRRVFVRPCEISEPHDGQAILRVATGRPDCDISLTEFLIGLLAVTVGPKNQRDWLKRYRTAPSRADLEAAFAPLTPAMNLDGEGPRFFQDWNKFDGRSWPCASLFGDAPGDNAIKENSDHFIKRGRYKRLSRAGAAVALLTLQSIAPAGGSGQFSALRGPGPMTTLILPASRSGGSANLWEMLWANVPAHFDGQIHDLGRIFPWMSPTRTAASVGITTPDHVATAQCFFGMPRRVKLNFTELSDVAQCDLLGCFDSTCITTFEMKSGGTNYDAWPSVHPLTPVLKPGAQQAFRSYQLRSARVGYRQWSGIVSATASGLSLPAKSIVEFARRATDLDDPEKKASRILAAGYVFKPGQATALDFGEALLPLIVTGDARADDEVHRFAEQFVTAADLIANQLSNVVKRALFGEAAKADRGSTVLDAVRQRFWADTEQDFYAALRDSADLLVEAKGELGDKIDAIRMARGMAWLGKMRAAALAVFDETAPIDDAAGDKIKDLIEGRRLLTFALRGYGAVGGQVFTALWQPQVETKARKGRKAA
ncbi:MAG: type I-E CRISPR-associated protein Cse1/CasA [Hyphomicrobiaceae bacterium]